VSVRRYDSKSRPFTVIQAGIASNLFCRVGNVWERRIAFPFSVNKARRIMTPRKRGTKELSATHHK
jgi:hypothetical protein